MGRNISRHTLNLHCSVNKLFNIFVSFIFCTKLRAYLHSLLNRNIKFRWNEFCNNVNLVVRHIKNTANVPDCTPCRHSTEGNYLSHARLSVFTYNVINYLFSSSIRKVYVKVRHTDSLGVKKSLESKIIFKRVNIRNFKAIRHKTCSA